jgi:hypothetical protein
MWRTSWIGCMASTIKPVNTRRWPVTGWRPAKTVCPIPRYSMKDIMSGSTDWPGPGKSRLSSSHPGRPLQADQPDHWRGLPDPPISHDEEDGGTPGQTGVKSRGYSGRAGWRGSNVADVSARTPVTPGGLADLFFSSLRAQAARQTLSARTWNRGVACGLEQKEREASSSLRIAHAKSANMLGTGQERPTCQVLCEWTGCVCDTGNGAASYRNTMSGWENSMIYRPSNNTERTKSK